MNILDFVGDVLRVLFALSLIFIVIGLFMIVMDILRGRRSKS